jgi:FlaA1/EpsC-like NDP-sugar epimerase
MDRIKRGILSNRQVLIFISLLGTVLMSQLASFLLRFEFVIPPVEVRHLGWGAVLAVVCKLSVLYWRRQHRGFLSFSGLGDLRRALEASLGASLAFVAVMLVVDPRYPRSIYILDLILTTGGICGLAVVVRMIRESRREAVNAERGIRNTLIYGAGEAGKAVAGEIGSNPKLGMKVVGFLDDDANLRHEILLGVPVRGTGAELPGVLEKLAGEEKVVDQIIVAIPSAGSAQLTKIVELCRASGVACRTLPGLGDLLNNQNLSLQIRDINVEDLLGRDKVDLEEDKIRETLTGKVVMITGAAGSIGSDLAACVAAFRPAKLVLFDIAESPLFQVDLSLRAAGYGEMVVAVMGDIRDYGQLKSVMGAHRVQVIFHAAAFKHVPLVEEHVVQAAMNNIVGTYNVAEAAWNSGVETFTLISSDKAVRPANFMGASKRAAEMIVSSYPRTGGTRFSAVRFGNVLGSNGSVVPTFRWQISRGGPVTVTHPEVTRYFMTIREAVQLVLQTTAMSAGSDIFVLDMGQPVKIVDLARNVIRLAGFEPEVDIAIEYTGLRPGEKLYEELIAQGEYVVPTYHEKVKIFTGPAPGMETVLRWLSQLEKLIQASDAAGVVKCLADLVPGIG